MHLSKTRRYKRVKEENDTKEKIKPKDVKKKIFSSVSVQTKDVHVECSSLRKSSFHPDEYHISSFTNKPHADKIHAEKERVAHTPEASLKPVGILK